MSIKSLYHKLIRSHWDLAFVEALDGDLVKGNWKFSFVKYSTEKRWFADPFILDVTDDDIILLVEEMTYSIAKGRIAKIVINRNTLEIKDEKIILELPTHLSFPAIFRNNEEIFVYPENAQSGQLSIYKFCQEKSELQLVSVLANDKLTDAILVTHYNKPYIFSTVKPESNGNILSVFSADSYMGKYSKIDEVVFPEKMARGAGDMFIYQDKLIRPAQLFKGKYSYGAGISFQEVAFNGDSFLIKEIKRVLPPRGYVGMHTFNTYKGYAVVDCLANDYPCFNCVVGIIKEYL